MTFKKLPKFFLFLLIAAVCAAAIRAVYLKAVDYLYPTKYSEFINMYSDEYGVDRALIYAVINCESSFESDAVSHAGAIGLMQITPDTFAWLQTKTPEDEHLEPEALYDPQTAIKYGTLLLSLHLDEFGGVSPALAAYHAGRGSVNSWLEDSSYSSDGETLSFIPFDDTRKYVERVERNVEIYRRLYGL